MPVWNVSADIMWLMSIEADYKMVLDEIGVNKEMLECLIWYESRNVEDAIGDAGRAFGVLQFWQSTFNQYKKRYGAEWLEYKNASHQIILADLMVREDINNLTHWTAYKFCR